MPAELVDAAGWCWFGDPRALYYDGRIYYGWVDPYTGNIWAGQVNTVTWTRRRALVAADTQVDDHNNPSFMVRGGRLVVFWCGHMGATMRYRVANTADLGDGFGPVITCAAGNTPGGNGFTYPSPAQMAHDNAAYLFWRGGNFQPTYSKTTSPNGVGSNLWQPARHLFQAATGQRPYVKVAHDSQARIHFWLTDAHPHAAATSIYYVRWHLDDGTFRKADGTVVGNAASLPISVVDLEKVYDGVALPRAWTWDLQLDDQGRPHGTFAVLHSRDDQAYYSARHDGTGWTVARVCSGGGTVAQNSEHYYSGGVVLDPLDLDAVVVGRQKVPDQLHRIERWATTDKGETWQLDEVLSDAAQQNLRPYFVRDAPAGVNWRLQWLQGTYGDFKNWRLRLVGDYG